MTGHHNPSIKAGRLFLLLLSLAFLQLEVLYAKNYYVDPVSGDTVNDGTEQEPWKTLAEVFSSGETFEAGDTVLKLFSKEMLTLLPKEARIIRLGGSEFLIIVEKKSSNLVNRFTRIW